MEGPGATDLGHRQFRDIVAGEFQRTLATDTLLGTVGEGCEAVDLLKNDQVTTGAFKGLEATESLVVLGEDADTCTCDAGASVTCSVVLLVTGMWRLSMAMRFLARNDLFKTRHASTSPSTGSGGTSA
jgi:hypothetical protein